MKGHFEVKKMFCAVGFLLGLMVNNGAWASGIASNEEVNEIESRIRNAYDGGGPYALREEVLNCYYRNMPSFSGMKHDMAKQRDAIRKSVGLKYCALENEKAESYTDALMKQDEYETPKMGIKHWFPGNMEAQSTALYERLIFGSTDAKMYFMGDAFTGKSDMWP